MHKYAKCTVRIATESGLKTATYFNVLQETTGPNSCWKTAMGAMCDNSL